MAQILSGIGPVKSHSRGLILDWAIRSLRRHRHVEAGSLDKPVGAVIRSAVLPEEGAPIFNRLKRMAALVLASFAAVATLVPAEASPASPRIVAVGDLHGDYEAYVEIIRAAGLVDERNRWAAGDAIFVQTGDVADRGPDSLRIMRHLVRIQRQAERAGGRVVVLVGNHEAMNVVGDLRYVHPGEYAAFADRNSRRRRENAYRANRESIEDFYRRADPSMLADAVKVAWTADTPLGWVEHRAAWAPGGELGRWVIGNPAVVLIDGTLFAHGGIGAAYASVPIDEINRRVAAALTAGDASPDAIINDPLGPLWYRGLATRGPGPETGGAAPLSVEDELDLVLLAFGARRMVIGHTPSLDGIRLLHGGRLARIDSGIAAAYGGRRTFLEIRGGAMVAHLVDRSVAPAVASDARRR